MFTNQNHKVEYFTLCNAISADSLVTKSCPVPFRDSLLVLVDQVHFVDFHLVVLVAADRVALVPPDGLVAFEHLVVLPDSRRRYLKPCSEQRRQRIVMKVLLSSSQFLK